MSRDELDPQAPDDTEIEGKRARGWMAALALGLGVLLGAVLISSGDYDTTAAVIEVARIALAVIAVLALTRAVRRAIQQ